MPTREFARPRVRLRALEAQSLTQRAYEELRRAIAEIPLYDGRHDGHLDERALAEQLGISRTPVREALLRLQNEGIVRTVPRRGVYVIRKTKKELIEVVLASAALEGMAARLAARRASDAEITQLRDRFLKFSASQAGRESDPSEKPEGVDPADTPAGSGGDAEAPDTQPPIAIDEYSELNVTFHQRIVDLAHSELFSQEVARLQVHMRAIRHSTIGDSGRLLRSVVDHTHIVEALEARDADVVERHVRQHALDLAEHVRLYRTDLD